MWEVKVTVFLKTGVLDVQGRAIEQVLHSHGYNAVKHLSMGKSISFLLDTKSREEAETLVNTISSSILVNPLIETFTYTIEPCCKEEVYR